MVLLLVVAFGSQSTDRTEPLFDGADDAMAIFLALRSPELEVLGLTTTFGNVHTALATRNALHLVPSPTFLPLSLFPHPHTLLACSAHFQPRLTFASDVCASAGGCWQD